MFKNTHIQAKLVKDTPVPAAVTAIKNIRIDHEDLEKIGEVAKKTLIVGGAVVLVKKVVDTACQVAIIYAQK